MGRGGSGPGQATVVGMDDGACILREGSGQSPSGAPLSPVACAAAAVASNLVRTMPRLPAWPHPTSDVHASLEAAEEELFPSRRFVRLSSHRVYQGDLIGPSMQDVGALGSSPPGSFSHQMGLFMQVPTLPMVHSLQHRGTRATHRLAMHHYPTCTHC